MSAIAQTRTCKTGSIVQRYGPCAEGVESMLLIIGALIMLTLVVILSRVRTGVNAAKLGWMSERWLAEYRAAHP